jgi:hypothetical protein
MATWEDLDKDLNSDEDIEEAHLALMAQASSDEESNSDSDKESCSDYEDEDDIFSKLSRANLVDIIQSLLSRCEKKAREIKELIRQYDLDCNELKTLNKKSQNDQVKTASDKQLNEQETALQEFILDGFNRSKLASNIYI